MNPFDFFTTGKRNDYSQDGWEEKIEEMGKTTLDASLVELRHEFYPSAPYRIGKCGTIACIEFNHEFIEHLMEYFETGHLENMPKVQREFMGNFIMFEDHYSTSALKGDNGGDVVGATVSQKVVAKDYTATTIDAQPARYDVPNAELYDALDKVLMTIVDGSYVRHYF